MADYRLVLFSGKYNEKTSDRHHLTISWFGNFV